jgi:DNA-3-methyladenine glycosylase II
MKKAMDFLGNNDPVMRRIINEKGKISLKPNKDYFNNLVQSIMYQQLNGKAATVIYNRFLDLFLGKKPDPKLLSRMDEEKLVSAGISRQKRSYLYSLAEKFLDKTITPEGFQKMEDDEIINELVQVRGIGRWSAQMFLIFSLARKDVFAPDDFGLRRAMMLNYKMQGMPKPKEAEEFARMWKPYRTFASLYLWKSVD